MLENLNENEFNATIIVIGNNNNLLLRYTTAVGRLRDEGKLLEVSNNNLRLSPRNINALSLALGIVKFNLRKVCYCSCLKLLLFL